LDQRCGELKVESRTRGWCGFLSLLVEGGPRGTVFREYISSANRAPVTWQEDQPRLDRQMPSP
jgi:hypothetical protein